MKYCCCCIFILFANLLFAQVPDSLVMPIDTDFKVDSTEMRAKLDSLLRENFPKEKKKNFIGRIFDKSDYPNPKKALYLSLLLPGSGQFYNKQYWKMPIVYGLYTYAIINIRDNRKKFKFYRDNRIAELDEDPTTINDTGLDDRSLQSLRDNALTKAETGFLILLIVHAVQSADAFVFSHLKSFDVNEDLSLRVSPQMGLDPLQRWNAGVQVALSISEKKAAVPSALW